jgi:uncharacterized OB-fold protein
VGKQIPIVDYLVIDDGEPHLVAYEATGSGALYLDRRNADAKTGETGFTRRKLERTGTLRTFSIIHRAAKGVPVPYVSAVVDLDGGGTVKANVVNTEPDSEHVTLGMRVRLTTYVAGTDDEGTECVAFGFEPIDAT